MENCKCSDKKSLVVKIINKSKNPLPEYSTIQSAGIDLRASIPDGEVITINPGGRELIPTGLFMELPNGFEAQIRPRSGLAIKNGVTVLNSPGTIDCLTGDTTISLLDGTSDTLENIVKRVNNGEVLYTYSVNDSTGNLAPGLITHAVSKGFRKVIKVEFDNGTTIKCTENHEFRTYDGTYIKASDLKVGDSISPLNRTYDKDGYELFSSLKYDMIGKTIRVHRAIFSEVSDEHPEIVHHLDENKRNNVPENLAGMTHKQHYQAHPSHSKMHEWANTEEGKIHLSEFGSRMANNDNRLKSLKGNPNMKGCLGYKFTEEQRMNSSKSAKDSWKNASSDRRSKSKDTFNNNIRELKSDPVRYKSYLDKIKKSKIKTGLEIVKSIISKGIEVTEESYREMKNLIYPNKKGIFKLSSLIKEFGSMDNLIKSSVNHKVRSITYLDKEHEVYDLTIDKYHNFLAEDVFVHNCDYRGEIKVILANLGDKPFEIKNGERIAQMVISEYTKVSLVEYESLSETERGDKGFGHTGVK